MRMWLWICVVSDIKCVSALCVYILYITCMCMWLLMIRVVTDINCISACVLCVYILYNNLNVIAIVNDMCCNWY